MMSRVQVELGYGYPIEDKETDICIRTTNGEELARFYGEEARELFSILTGNQGLFERKKGKGEMATKRKMNVEKAVEMFEKTDLQDNALLARLNPEKETERLLELDKWKHEKDKKEAFDPVTGPAHYISGRQYEPRKVIMDWDLDFYLGNVVKYISRAGRKGDVIEDLKKAKQYLEWEIEYLEGYLK